MTKDNPNQVVLVSTTTKGYLYTVYHKDDSERKKILYTGELCDNPKESYCECAAYVHGLICYHLLQAKKIMEVPLV